MLVIYLTCDDEIECCELGWALQAFNFWVPGCRGAVEMLWRGADRAETTFCYDGPKVRTFWETAESSLGGEVVHVHGHATVERVCNRFNTSPSANTPAAQRENNRCRHLRCGWVLARQRMQLECCRAPWAGTRRLTCTDCAIMTPSLALTAPG